MVLQLQCEECGEIHYIKVTDQQYKELNNSNGKLVQEIIPQVSPDIREILISGRCGKCFDRYFGYGVYD